MKPRFLQGHSLKTRVTLLMLLLLLLSSWSVAFYASTSLREDMQGVLGEQQFSTVKGIAQEIDGSLRDRMRALETIAREVTPALLADREKLQALLAQRPLLLLLFNGGVFIADRDGTAVADVPVSAGRVGTNYSDRTSVSQPLKDGKTLVGRPAIGKKLGTPVFSIGAPIVDSDGRVVGVMVGTINLGLPNFLDQIAQTRYGKTGGYLLFAPQHGLIVTASDKARVMQPAPLPGVNPLYDRYTQGYEGYGIAVSSRGVQELSAAKGIASAGWLIVAALPTDEAFVPIDGMMRRLFTAATVTTLVAALLSWWLTTLLLKRQLAPLVVTSRAIATQNHSDQPARALPIGRRDEIGALIGGFNQLLQTLEQREAALRHSEQQYRHLVENLSSAVVVHRPDTSIVLSNPQAEALLGLTTDQMMGKAAPDPGWHFLREDRSVMPLEEYPVNRVLALDAPIDNYVAGVRRPDRSDPTWVLCNAYPLRNEAGALVQVVVTFVDITQHKHEEARMRLAANVFAHAREGITITDPDGTIIEVNDAFTRITGYAREEAIGQNSRFLKSGVHDAAFYAAMWGALLSDGYWTGEIWNRSKGGALFAELIAISAVRDASGVTQHYVALFSDITATKEHQQQLEHVAHFDVLTNLPNRALLADRLQLAMAQAQRRQQQLAVAYLDLDGFKAINDRHGHQVGDLVLTTLAQRMKHALREGDTLSRLGGDEFVAVLIDLEDASACLPMLTRLLAAAAQPVEWEDLSLKVSASLGVTFYPQADEQDADQLLRQADQAMYLAKVAGKNRYQIFDAAQDLDLRGHHESLERIRVALEHREFVLHYQPKVNMRTGKVVGTEALIRWQHPEKGLLAPATFLPVIEDHPLAVAVGEWVIDTALTQVVRWKAVGLDLPVSVNISARQLQQGDFVARLEQMLQAHPETRAENLQLELLESSALEDMSQVSQVIEDCASMGVQFALDDFGTGYSSLTYLKQLRVSLLKIDQSFVRDMLEDPDDMAILQGVIGLAEAFKREVLAEGVETVEHGTVLLRLGCELAQGYGIARPMPPEQFPAWVHSWEPDAAWSELP